MPYHSITCSRCDAPYLDWSQAARDRLMARIWVNVDRHGPVPDYRPDLGPCWLWMRPLHPSNGGYATISLGTGRRRVVHRMTWEDANGPIPDGLTIDHLCSVPACVNPCHLEAVTMRENVLRADGPGALAIRTGQCKRGHAMTVENTVWGKLGRGCRTCKQANERRRYQVAPALNRGVRRGERLRNAKLTEQRVRAIRDDHAAGMSIAALARAQGVSRTTISLVVNRKRWRHVA